MSRTAVSLRELLLTCLAVLHLSTIATAPVSAQAPVGAAHPAAPAAARRLTLEEARDLALANNLQLQLGQMNLAEKGIAVSAAKRDYFPKLLGTGAYLHFDDNLGTVLTFKRSGPGLILPSGSRVVEATVVNQNTAIASIMVAQPITKLIGVSALVDIARADEGIAAAQLEKGTRDLLSGVNQAYYGLLAAKRVKVALGLQLQALQPLLKASPNPELRLGELEVRKGLAETEKQIAELTDLLNQLLGLPPCTMLELVEPALPPVRVRCAAEAADFALANSPQVREAEQNIGKARAGIKAAKMDYLPDVNIVGGYAAQTAADYIQNDFTFVGVVGSYTFFDWCKRREVLKQRHQQMMMASQNVHAVMETVALDARKAFQAYKEAEELLHIAHETVLARQDAEKGATALPDIMTAKSATAKAQLDEMQAEVNFRVAHAKLLAVTGQP
jgi:outer membrane protein TolC